MNSLESKDKKTNEIYETIFKNYQSSTMLFKIE